jgi:hypothetical protein
MRTVSRYLGGLATLMLSASVSLSAATIVITNPSFEDDPLEPGVISNASPTGWNNISQNGAIGFWHDNGSYINGVPDGVNHLFVGFGNPGAVAQTLSAVLQANTLYTLSYYVGSRSDIPLGDYTVYLTAGGVTLASDSGGNPTLGNFVFRSFSFTAGANPDGEGLELGIGVYDLGNDGFSLAQGEFDAFSLSTGAPESGTPEPSTLFLMGGAMLAAAGWSRRRKGSAAGR